MDNDLELFRGRPRKAAHPIAYLQSITTADENGCWTSGSKRYGTIRINGKTMLRHRFAWEAANGEVPIGLYVCHRCNNKSCCNPDHLYLGTHAENVRDAWRDGLTRGPSVLNAKKKFCIRGHELFGKNLKITKSGHRLCMTCSRMHALNHYYKKKRVALLPVGEGE